MKDLKLRDLFGKTDLTECSCASSNTPMQDRTADNAAEDNDLEIDEMVTNGQINKYEPDYLRAATGRIRHTRTDNELSAFLGKPVTESNNGDNNMFEQLIIKHLIEESEDNDSTDIQTESNDKLDIESLFDEIMNEESSEEQEDSENVMVEEESNEDGGYDREYDEQLANLEESFDEIFDKYNSISRDFATLVVNESIDLTYNVIASLNESELADVAEDEIIEFDEEGRKFLIDAVTIAYITGNDDILEKAFDKLQDPVIQESVRAAARNAGHRVYHTARSAVMRGVGAVRRFRANRLLSKAAKLEATNPDKAKKLLDKADKLDIGAMRAKDAARDSDDVVNRAKELANERAAKNSSKK